MKFPISLLACALLGSALSAAPGTWSDSPDGQWLNVEGDSVKYLFRDGVQVGIRHANGTFQTFDSASQTFGPEMVSAVGPAIEVKPEATLRESRTVPEPTVKQPLAVADALDAANAERAKRGLQPFARDEGLMQGAQACAVYRAANLMAGHTSDDFSFLPPGVSAPAAGCAAWEPGWGFGSCCLYEGWTFAGAASVTGRDGMVYHQLFVR